jgi:GNAT superfamily N-acetyltransferase
MGQVMIVRKPTPSEFDSTVMLFERYHEEAALTVKNITEYDENSVIETIRQFCSLYEYCWFNLFENSRPVGFVAAYVTQCPWNRQVAETHIAFIYIIESHRTMDNFRLLINQIEQFNRTIGGVAITAGDIGINPERTQRLFEHFDFKPGVWMGKETIDESI